MSASPTGSNPCRGTMIDAHSPKQPVNQERTARDVEDAVPYEGNGTLLYNSELRIPNCRRRRPPVAGSSVLVAPLLERGAAASAAEGISSSKSRQQQSPPSASRPPPLAKGRPTQAAGEPVAPPGGGTWEIQELLGESGPPGGDPRGDRPSWAFQLGWVSGGEENAIFPSRVSFLFGSFSLDKQRERMSSPYAFAEGINNPRPYRAGDRKGEAKRRAPLRHEQNSRMSTGRRGCRPLRFERNARISTGR